MNRLLLILKVLGQNPDISITELSRLSRAHYVTCLGNIKEMIDIDLIDFTYSLQDKKGRKRRLYRLSKKGKEIYEILEDAL